MVLDYQMIILNAGSFYALAETFLDENNEINIDMSLTTVGGFLVLLSVVALNLAKAYKEIKTAKKQNEDKESE